MFLYTDSGSSGIFSFFNIVTEERLESRCEGRGYFFLARDLASHKSLILFLCCVKLPCQQAAAQWRGNVHFSPRQSLRGSAATPTFAEKMPHGEPSSFVFELY